jgi:hypothetical protein
MPSLRRHEGYVFLDRGISPQMNRMGIDEMPCFTCPHCSYLVIMNAQRTRARGYCAKCDHWVCDKPGCNAECNPIIRDVALAQRFSESGHPFLSRSYRGELLYPKSFQDKERIY